MPPRKRRAIEGTPTSPEDRIAEALSAISEALDDIAAASPNLVASVEDGRDAQSVVKDWVESHRQYADGLVCKCGKDIEMSYVFAKCFHVCPPISSVPVAAHADLMKRACSTCAEKKGLCCGRKQSKFHVIFEEHDRCGICLETRSWMSFFQCGHTICTGCAQNVIRENDRCPICRDDLKDGVVAQYPTFDRQ